MVYECFICKQPFKTLHKFPKTDLIDTWLYNCGLSNSIGITEKRVCIDHFEANHYHSNSNKLKRGAFPVKNLKIANPITAISIIKAKRKIHGRKCCICLFSNRDSPSERSFFQFPSKNLTKNPFICIKKKRFHTFSFRFSD